MSDVLARLLPKATPQTSQIVLLAGTAARMVFSLALTVVVGRYLVPEEFGFFALVSTVFGLGFEFTDLGTVNIAARGVARDRARERETLEHMFGLRLVLGVVTALACTVLALAQPTRQRELILLISAIILAFSYVGGLTTVYAVRQRQEPLAVLTIGVQFATVLGALLLIWLGSPQTLFPLLPVIREAVVFIGLVVIATRVLGYMPRPRFSRAALKPFFGKAAIVALATLLYHSQVQAGIFFVEFLRPENELAPFGAALRPLAPMLQVPAILMLPVIPLLSWLSTERRGEFKRQAQATVELFIGFSAVTIAASYQLAPAVLQLLYGAKFASGPLSAIETLRWFSLPLGGAFVNVAIAAVLLADNREVDILKLTCASLVFYIVANLYFLPRYGFNGSAMASALSAVVTTGGGLLLLRSGRERISARAKILIYVIPGIALFFLLNAVGGYFGPGTALLHFAAGAILSVGAMIAVWQLPSAVRYRAEQSSLSRLAVIDGPVDE